MRPIDTQVLDADAYEIGRDWAIITVLFYTVTGCSLCHNLPFQQVAGAGEKLPG